MYHENHGQNSGYRIKKHRNNFISEDMHLDSDERKISVHSSSHQSPLKRSRNNISMSHKANQDKYSTRSKKTIQTQNNLSLSSMSGSGKRIEPNNKIKEFANVKQLLMIKAYDKKLLRKVTGSNEANKNFLKMGDIKDDPFRMETFKVMVENFKEMVIRIRRGYEKVLNKILFQNENVSALATLANVKPTLMKVREEADNMFCKVKECQETHDSREFRNLLNRFETFLNASEEIENIIIIVNESKNRIDGLFKNLEKEKESGLDKKVNHERKKGIKKVRRAVSGYQKEGLEAEILDRVEAAINEMADKTLEAYSHINGARGLMNRIKECLRQNRDFYELEDIVKINEIFKEILFEASEYEKFSEKFLENDDLVNDDLRKCILKYREEVEINRKAVFTMELKFISNIIESSILTLEGSYSVCNAIDSTVCEDYKKVETLLEDICEFISDENAKVSIQSMLRDIKPRHRNIQRLIKKLQITSETVYIDTSQGLQNISELSEIIEEYKDNLKEMIEREDRAHKEVTKKKVKRQIIGEVDLEQECIRKMVSVSQKFNDPKRKKSIENCAAFKTVAEEMNIKELASEIGEESFFKELKDLYKNFEEIQQTNELSTIIKEIKMEEKLYEMSSHFLEVYQISGKTTEQNVLQQINKITDLYTKQECFFSSPFNRFFERVYCLLLTKGLSAKILNKICNHNLFEFPNNQHDIESYYTDIKYLKTLISLFPEIRIKNVLQISSEIGEFMLEGARIVESIKWNKNGMFFIDSSLIFELINERFHLFAGIKGKVSEKKIRKDKKINEVEEFKEKLNKTLENLSVIKSQENSNKIPQKRSERTLQTISHYYNATETLSKSFYQSLTLSPKESYSQFVLSCCKYLEETNQSFYSTLSPEGCVIWICEWSELSKYSKFGEFIGLPLIKCGEVVKKYVQTPIKASNPQPKQKVEKIKVKKESKTDEMEEEIVEENNEISDNIDEDMEIEMSENIENSGEIGEDMVEEFEEEKISSMGEEILGEESMMDDIVDEAEVGQEVVEDEFDFDEEIEKKQKNVNDKISVDKNKNQKVEQLQPAVITHVPSEPELPKLTLVSINPKKTFETFKYIKSLESLEILLQSLETLVETYCIEIEIKEIEKYYNGTKNIEEKNMIKERLKENLEKLCREKFNVDIIMSVKDSHKYKDINQVIDSLIEKNIDILTKILDMQNKSYSFFKDFNQETLKISVKNNESWYPQVCVEQYFLSYLPSLKQTLETFSLSSYVSTLQTINSSTSTIYKIPSIELSPNNTEIIPKLASINEIIHKYESMQLFPDGLPLGEVIICLWAHCVGYSENESSVNGSSELKVPKIIRSDISTLQQVENKENLIHYLTAVGEASKKSIKNLEDHEGTLNEILTKTNKECLLKNISRLMEIYKCSEEFIIFYHKQPLLYTNTYNSKDTKNSENRNEIPYKELYKTITNIFSTSSSNTQVSIEGISKKTEEELQNPEVPKERIYRLMSILSINMHILLSTSIHLKTAAVEIYNIIVSQISNKRIESTDELSENIIEKNVLVQKYSEYIYLYSIKETEIMNVSNNVVFYEQFIKIQKEMHNNSNDKTHNNDVDMGCSIWEILTATAKSTNSEMNKIVKYQSYLRSLLNEKILSEPMESIFKYHTDTQEKLKAIKANVHEEEQVIERIVNAGINEQKDLGSIGGEAEVSGNLISEWYMKYRKVNVLHKVYFNFEEESNSNKSIGTEGDGKEMKVLVYIGKNKNKFMDYLAYILGRNSNDVNNSYALQIENKKESSGSTITTVHVSKIISEICQSEATFPIQNYIGFVSNYNQAFFQSITSSALKESHAALLGFYKRSVIDELEKSIKNFCDNKIIEKMLINKILKELGNLVEHKENIEKQRKLLESISLVNFEYEPFYQWFKTTFQPKNDSINQKQLHDLECVYVEDLKTKGTILFVFCVKNENDIEKELTKLKLANKYVVKENKKNCKTISLAPQEVTLSLNSSIILTDELNIFTPSQTTPSKALYIYERLAPSSHSSSAELKLLLICPLTSSKIHLPLELPAFTLHKNIYVKLQDVSVDNPSLSEKTSSPRSPIETSFPTSDVIIDERTHVICCLKSEEFKEIKVGSLVLMDEISKEIKRLVLKIEEQRKENEKKERERQERIKKEEEEKLKEIERLRMEEEKRKEEQEAIKEQYKSVEQEETPKIVLFPPLVEPKSLQSLEESNQKEIVNYPSIDNIPNNETKEYLNDLYKKLEEQNIYALPKNYQPSEQNNNNKNHNIKNNDSFESLPNFVSAKDTELYVTTQKTLKEEHENFQSLTEKQNFKQTSQKYLRDLESYIKEREELLREVLRIAIEYYGLGHPPKKTPENGIKHKQEILSEIKGLEGWMPELEQWVVKILNNLTQENKDLVTGIYGENENKR